MALAVGARLGPYEITGEVGVGGMGEVYRATDAELGRDVAIKTLPVTLAEDPDRLARFEHEAKTLASLNHANIAQIYGLERSDGAAAIVMELVEGPTLADRIERGPIPADEALDVSMQIADALEAAHEQGIVHRDLKPANVKLKPDGSVKVLDFGIAKTFDPQSQSSGPQSPVMTTPVTQAGIILGTAAYKSPEQARGKKVDQRTDIWAFGCVLYEMLTGQPVFGGEDVSITLARVLERDTDMTSLPAMISPAVRQTIELCLRKDPRERLHAIGDVRLALRGAFETAPSLSAPKTDRRFWTRPLPIAIGAFLIGAVAAGLVIWSVLQPEPRPVNRFDYDLPVGQGFRNLGRSAVAISPDGRNIVYNTTAGLHVRAMGELEGRLLAGTETTSTSPSFSPDGQAIVYWDERDSQLKRMAIAGGAAFAIADVPVNPFGIKWEADGTILFGQREGVFRVSQNGGAPELVVMAQDGERIYGPSLLPDSDYVLFNATQTGWDASQIVAESLATGGRTALIEGGSEARYVPAGYLLYAFENTLFAAAFDPASLTVTGGAVPLVQGVARANAEQTGVAHYGISDDGTLVYIATSAGTLGPLVWMDREGREEEIYAIDGAYTAPRISPDGEKVAFGDAAGGIWIADLEADTRTRLTTNVLDARLPVWSPDGTRIAYTAGVSGIAWKASNNTGSPENIATGLSGVGPRLIPYFFAEQQIVFGLQSSRSRDDILMLTVGSDAEPVRLLDGPYEEVNAALSPDGQWIAYQSDETGDSQIYVRPFPEVDRDSSPVSNNGGMWPVWSPTGGELLYVETPDVGQRRLISVTDIDATDGGFSFNTRTPLFDWPDQTWGFFIRPYDVSRDGRRFLVSKTGNGGNTTAGQIIIVENWTEELERLVPTE
jgi:serine/threonine protein kinase/Tol biopolymer transport system component